MIYPGELVQLVSPKGKRYLRTFNPDDELHTHDGKLDLNLLDGTDFGDYIQTHLGKKYRVLKPTLHDLLKNIKRETQIIYPKDIGYILLKLSVGPGSRIIEFGSGSGSLTLALAWYVGSTGIVYSFERREKFLQLCARNLARVGLQDNVKQINQDIGDGIDLQEMDSAFMDVRTPWEYLDQIAQGLRNGAPVGFLLPTVNQVSDLLQSLENAPFSDVEVVELMLRHYKPVPDRLRPEDRMIAHTGFLVFARLNIG
ncbi:MAG: tRNA (adenine-N1)-methyltransferase [Thermodesulfobacteriota bacterium]